MFYRKGGDKITRRYCGTCRTPASKKNYFLFAGTDLGGPVEEPLVEVGETSPIIIAMIFIA